MNKLYEQRKREVAASSKFREFVSDDDKCLEFMFFGVYGGCAECSECGKPFRYHRLKNSKKYCCQYCGHIVSPLANTIFHKSSTPLSKWFQAIYEMSIVKNGISALELMSKIDVTYKTAWRMFRQIRGLFDSGGLISGVVEIDEGNIGGVGNKTTVLGAWVVSRSSSQMRLKSAPEYSREDISAFIDKNVDRDSIVYTDGNMEYRRVGFREREYVIHSKQEYVRGAVHTLTIDGFWAYLRKSIRGTYTSVSKKYFQRYLDEFAFRRSFVGHQVFPFLLALLPNQVSQKKIGRS